ncbi:hypothetical protein GCM10010172_35420 [Paractinoplanes ferrugineus]|uniref:ERF superfamily protein n=1 Tax=Paractinoplanes ferrugineus TaxID=113564 RepID=A0A919JB90_9ACTN|nr:ERF family protein [Actinoplanes ferrugineus]GIE16874.1 hypothetical protein Afe05nite_87140 [Actinoplanes ferrugineus]
MTTAAMPVETKNIGTLAEALADLQTQLPHVAKNNTAKAGTYSYNYADLAEISRQLLPVMGKLGLSFTSKPTLLDGKFVLAYKLRHISGESDEGVWPLPERGSPQEIGSAVSYARRYCLCAVTGLAPDNDGEDAVLAEQAARKQRVERVEERIAATQAPAEPRINAGQQKEMQDLFPQAGIGAGKADRVQFAVTVVKRQIGSATELTQAEAKKVIDRLQQLATRRVEQVPAEAPEAVAESQP